MPWPKGRHLSKEHKRKLSEANKGQVPWNYGKHLSEETRRKMSLVNSGENNPFYGKHHSEETRIKISEAMSGQNHPLYDKTGEKHPMYGKHHSEESKRKMSLNHRDNSGEKHPMYGKHHSEESKRKISEASKNPSEETRRKISLATSGEKNPMYGKRGEEAPRWLGGISFEPYGPEFNDEIREQIRKRDNYQCQLCRRYQEELSRLLSVHHIDYDKENNSKRNLISLCDSCHGKTGVNRDEWTAYFRYILFSTSPQAPLVEAPPLPQRPLEPA